MIIVITLIVIMMMIIVIMCIYIYIFTWLWIFKWIFDIRYFGKYSLDLGRFHGDQMRIWFCVMSLLSHQGGWSPIRLSISNEWMEDDPACQVYINMFIQYNPKWIPWYHILNIMSYKSKWSWYPFNIMVMIFNITWWVIHSI